MSWPRYPRILEINTWTWLTGLSQRHGRTVTLHTVPATEWDAVAAPGFDAVWLMGVWERSPAGTWIARQNPALVASWRKALPDYTDDDLVGSPYCIRTYAVDARLGGPEALAEARHQLAKRGLRLILDFVPNHVAPDHAWIHEHPEFFITGSEEDLRRAPAEFIVLDGPGEPRRVFARGRDPCFQAWPDVVQLNAFHPDQRAAIQETVAGIARQCDGVRCDMAMLVLNTVFEKTWGPRAGARPEPDYWPALIQAIHAHHPEFLFVAEAYWGLEWELQQQGFNFCYDKRLYDRLTREDALRVRQHLGASIEFQSRLVRFIENHDEPRAASILPEPRHRAAAVLLATLPGARLFHLGQDQGRHVHPPVFLSRICPEPVEESLVLFYARLLHATATPCLREGDWHLCDVAGWPGNDSCRHLLASGWWMGTERILTVVNFSDEPADGMVHLPWADLADSVWMLADPLSGERFERAGTELATQRLYVSLPPWGFHLFTVHAVG